MAAPTHGQTAENKARKHNIVYKTFGSQCVIKGFRSYQK
jgi:hypothetical protein